MEKCFDVHKCHSEERTWHLGKVVKNMRFLPKTAALAAERAQRCPFSDCVEKFEVRLRLWCVRGVS